MATVMTQYQQFQQAHARMMDTLKQAAWLAGLFGDNPNPLTREEIVAAAGREDRPYSWAFRLMLGQGELQRAPVTQAEKIQAYREGRYRFPAPPVSHALWSESAWVAYIDANGQWLGSYEKACHAARSVTPGADGMPQQLH